MTDVVAVGCVTVVVTVCVFTGPVVVWVLAVVGCAVVALLTCPVAANTALVAFCAALDAALGSRPASGQLCGSQPERERRYGQWYPGCHGRRVIEGSKVTAMRWRGSHCSAWTASVRAR
jgi:hypothetical protein